MSSYGSMILSKVVDENDVSALTRMNVTENHFVSDADKRAYAFVKEYAKDNAGRAPSYAALVEVVPEFNYIPGVEDSFKYLQKRLYNESALDKLTAFISGEKERPSDKTLAELYEEYQGDTTELIERLQDVFESIKTGHDTRDKIGTDAKRDTEKFMSEYDKRKAGLSAKQWRSRFANVNTYTSGNLYVVYGKSGRGKSVTTLADVIYMAQQGARCLIWGMEMPWFEIMVRLYAILSADEGASKVNFAGIDMSAGFDSSQLREGRLKDEFEEQFREFLRKLSEDLAGELFVRAVDDEDFNDRTLRALEADILQTEADVVLIDPFYYLDYEKNRDNTTGGAAAETSKKLRKLTGRLQVVTIAITQADEEIETKDDAGNRELEIPKRKDVTKTKQLLQDAYQLIGVDTDYKQGRGLVGVNKGRDGGEGDVVEIMYMPQFGICRALEVGEASILDFEGIK